MAPRRILVVTGHPDPAPRRLCRMLANAYAEGAVEAGHAVRRTDIAMLEFPVLRTNAEFEHSPVPDGLAQAAADIAWAEHIVFVFPLWLGTMPALLKAFLEQVMRPGVAFAYTENRGGLVRTLFDGRSARVVVTMGMPGLVYRLWYLAHGIAGMRRNILNFVGIRPVRETVFGGVANAGDVRRRGWVDEMRALGRKGA